MQYRSLPLPTDSHPNKLLSSNHDHLAGITRSTSGAYIYNKYTIRMQCTKIMCKENWELGGMTITGYHIIASGWTWASLLSPPLFGSELQLLLSYPPSL